ncbi:MAG TPA: FAD-dependent oxidoreductase, partial [bacterium]|nr:FAD-dependent oxidoreductase [bacterium]
MSRTKFPILCSQKTVNSQFCIDNAKLRIVLIARFLKKTILYFFHLQRQNIFMKNSYDVIIIGSGIVGSLTARYLSRYELSILVIEKEIDVGMCPSSANSAIIHAGYDPKPGTLKAKMNAEGNRLWHELAPELGIAYKKTGSLVVSFGPKDAEKLTELHEQGLANNIPGIRIMERDELMKQEPLLNPDAQAALYAPEAAVLDPFGAVLAAAENAVTNGVDYLFETSFEGFIFDGKRITGVITN